MFLQHSNAIEDTHLDANDIDEHENIEDWSSEKLLERSKQLQMSDSISNGLSGPNGEAQFRSLSGTNRMEEVTLSEVEEESKSASKSTTSDSQVSYTYCFIVCFTCCLYNFLLYII